MLFAPITARSFRIRILYLVCYAFLAIGAITMIVPFWIMVTGSLTPGTQWGDFSIVPSYLVNKTGLWRRYLENKYQGSQDMFRAAWGDSGVEFSSAPLPVSSSGDSLVAWRQFLKEKNPDIHLFSLGFIRSNRRLPSYNGREFRNYLLRESNGDLALLNQRFGTFFNSEVSILAPSVTLIGSLRESPYLDAYYKFCQSVPSDRLFAWNVGNYYRTIYLPRIYGRDIDKFNKRNNTHFSSYAEVPFTDTMPEIAAQDWGNFVLRVLRPDFVSLNAKGQQKFAASRLNIDEFLRTVVTADEVKVKSLDVLFAGWCREHGYAFSTIQQKDLDWSDFQKDANFWRKEFFCLNYTYVIDAILLHGRALWNTLILVVLTIAGALIVNPVAAYALSRYKPKYTYHILIFCLVTIAFPAEVTLIPKFLQLKEMHLLNTFGALVLPSLVNGFSVFLLKGFFDSLPRELYEAAEIDGAGEFTMFWQITMTLSKPILAVIALHAFVHAYGTFFYALLLAPNPKMWTLMVYIYQMRQGADPSVVYAALLLTALPTLLVFVFCQNIILRGIVVPSEK